MKRLGIAVGGVLLAVAGTAGGATAPGKADAYGAGVATCGRWIEARKHEGSPDELAMANWVAGFVTGAQTYDDPVYKESDVPSFLAYIDKYCTEHPLDRIAHAALSLTFQLKKHQ